jgi:hypothetical protein
MDRKKKIGLVIGLAIGLSAGSMLSYRTPAEGAKDLGADPTACEQSCPASAGCFCNRSCILFYCWGNYYCQCHD